MNYSKLRKNRERELFSSLQDNKEFIREKFNKITRGCEQYE